MCRMTRLAPRTESKVRLIKSSRAGVRTCASFTRLLPEYRVARRTCSHTPSSSPAFDSTIPLTKLKSVSLAAGYAISISLKPHLTSCRCLSFRGRSRRTERT